MAKARGFIGFLLFIPAILLVLLSLSFIELLVAFSLWQSPDLTRPFYLIEALEELKKETPNVQTNDHT